MSVESSAEYFSKADSDDKVPGSSSSDPPYQTIPSPDDGLCQPLTIYKGFLICSGLNDAFFLTAPGEKAVSTWAILPPLQNETPQQDPCDALTSPKLQSPTVSSNQFFLERLKTELSSESVARLLESEASKAQNLQKTPPATQGSKKRKNFKPYKSPSLDDPNFSGVQIRMNYRLKDGKLDFYSAHEFCNLPKSPKKPVRPKIPADDSQSESDVKELPIRPPPPPPLPLRHHHHHQQPPHHHHHHQQPLSHHHRLLPRPPAPRPHIKSHYAGKECASCGVRKTPLWRDAEDGTPLCNACGIRYKKYRIRCSRCWNIPRRGLKPAWKCVRCGKVF